MSVQRATRQAAGSNRFDMAPHALHLQTSSTARRLEGSGTLLIPHAHLQSQTHLSHTQRSDAWLRSRACTAAQVSTRQVVGSCSQPWSRTVCHPCRLQHNPHVEYPANATSARGGCVCARVGVCAIVLCCSGFGGRTFVGRNDAFKMWPYCTPTRMAARHHHSAPTRGCIVYTTE